MSRTRRGKSSARDQLRRGAYRLGFGVLAGSLLLAALASAAQPCIGDCDGDGAVSIDELIRGVNVALGTQAVDVCPSLDRDGDGTITIDELIAAVGVALTGCPEPAVSASAALAEGVVGLDADTEARIAAVDATSITFSGSPSRVAALHPGDLFIARNTARKVISLAVQNGNMVVQTVEPEFSEVFRMLQLSGTVVLSEYDLVPSASRRVQLTPPRITAGNSYTIPVNEGLLQGTVVLEKPQVDFKFHFGAPSPDPHDPSNQYASLHFQTGESVDLTLSSSAAFNVSRDIELLEFARPIPIAFGTVDLHLVVTLHLAADGSAQLVMGVHQGLAYDAGVTATLNPLVVTPVNGTTHDFHITAPQANGQANAVVAVDPEVDIRILQYSLAGIIDEFAIKASANASVDPNNACFRLQATAELASRVFLLLPKIAVDASLSWDTFFSGDISMARYPIPLFTIAQPIYDSGEQCALPPVANAGADLTTPPGQMVTLDGTGSHDPSGAALQTYAWAQLSGPAVSIAHADMPLASFTAPAAPATLMFRLTVTNAKGAIASDDVLVTVAVPMATPTPSATATQGVPPASPTAVRATAGDGEVQLAWGDVSGATAYNVYVASMSGVNPTNYTSLPGGTRHAGVSSPFTETNVVNGTTYYFVVTAVNDGGESAASSEVSATPRDTSGPRQSSIASNSEARFTCVLLATGEVSCWGAFLGCQQIGGCLPQLVSGITNATMVAVGPQFACAVLADGTVRCWGTNVHHVLGNAAASSATPVAIAGVTNATAIAAGEGHVCAIIGGGAVTCWGDNYRGQLGNGTVGGESGVPATVSGISGATAVSAGYWHTCALVGNTVRCWGYNISGQLGESSLAENPECYGTSSWTPCPPSPAPLSARGIATATAVSAGSMHSCAVLSNGAVVCWGATGLRIDDPFHYSPVMPLEVRGISSATFVVAGYAHSCADSDGALYCWGLGNAGELGNGGNPSSTNAPVMVQNLTGAAAVAVGYIHTCAVTGAMVQCWGSNLSRMLGVGESNNPYSSNVPVTVTGISNAR